MWWLMKYKFKSFLKRKMNGYLSYRIGRGYKAAADFNNLCVYDRYVLASKVKRIEQLDEKFYLEMIARELEELKPQTVNSRLTVLNNFHKYLQRNHDVNFNPIEALPRLKELYYSPYVFRPDEIKTILDYMAKRAAESPKHFYFVRLSRYTSFCLQAACGMRISEVYRLKTSDFNQKEKTIYIEQSKFRKDRLIPISTNSTLRIQNYLSARSSLLNSKSPYLFLGYDGAAGNRKSLGWYFRKVLGELDMLKAPEIKGNVIFGSPTPHSLRHSFAVNTVRRWASEAKDIDKVADTLATYMGHADFEFTQIYLKGLNRIGPMVFNKDVMYEEK